MPCPSHPPWLVCMYVYSRGGPQTAPAPRPSLIYFLDLSILILLEEEYKLWSSSLCSFLQTPVTSLLLLLLLLWFYSPLLGLDLFFSFLIPYTVGRTPWTGDQPVARPLPAHRTTQTQTSMPLSGIRTHDISVRASEDSSFLRPRSYCDRLPFSLS
jgi:hypothetical protein